MRTVIIAGIVLLAAPSLKSFEPDDTASTVIKMDASDLISANRVVTAVKNDPNATTQTYEIVAVRKRVQTSLVKYSLPGAVKSGIGPVFALYCGLIKEKTLYFVYADLDNLYIGQAHIGSDNTFTDIKKSVLDQGETGLLLSGVIRVTDSGAIEIDMKDINGRNMSFQQGKSGDFKKK